MTKLVYAAHDVCMCIVHCAHSVANQTLFFTQVLTQIEFCLTQNRKIMRTRFVISNTHPTPKEQVFFTCLLSLVQFCLRESCHNNKTKASSKRQKNLSCAQSANSNCPLVVPPQTIHHQACSYLTWVGYCINSCICENEEENCLCKLCPFLSVHPDTFNLWEHATICKFSFHGCVRTLGMAPKTILWFSLRVGVKSIFATGMRALYWVGCRSELSTIVAVSNAANSKATQSNRVCPLFQFDLHLNVR